MKTLVVILLAISALGCGGYGSGSSSNSRSMAAGTPSISPPLVPNMATAGSTAFTLTVNGTGFVAQSIIYWNSMAHSTTFVTSSQLTAAIAASDHSLSQAWSLAGPSYSDGVLYHHSLVELVAIRTGP